MELATAGSMEGVVVSPPPSAPPPELLLRERCVCCSSWNASSACRYPFFFKYASTACSIFSSSIATPPHRPCLEPHKTLSKNKHKAPARLSLSLNFPVLPCSLCSLCSPSVPYVPKSIFLH